MTILLDEDLAGPLTDNAEMWDQFADLLTPPERVHPMAWIERNVFLPRTVSPMPGRVRIYPYQREPLDAMFDPTVREVVLCWGTQLGKSAIWQWLIPYYARTNPVPVMVVTPDRESAKKLSRLRIYPIIRDAVGKADRLGLSGLAIILIGHATAAQYLGVREAVFYAHLLAEYIVGEADFERYAVACAELRAAGLWPWKGGEA